MPDKTLRNVQAMRGFAALIVAAYHIQPMLNASFGTSLGFHFGAFGVDLFFVISGLVMYYSQAEMNRPIMPFVVGRLFRIVPLYWLVTLIMVLAYQIGFHPVGLGTFEPSMLLQSLFFVRTHFPDGRHDLIFSIGWTLIYELFFYTLFALTFPARTHARSLALVSLTFALLIAITLVVPGLHPNIAFFGNPIVVEFLMGAGIALAARRYGRCDAAIPAWTRVLAVLAIAGGCGIVLVLELYGGMGVPVAARGLVWGPPAALIIGGAVALEKAGRAFANRGVLLLGTVSYALYVFHPLVMQPTTKIAARLLPVEGAAGAALAAVLALSAAIAVAIAVHLKIERHVLEAGRQVVRRIGALPHRGHLGGGSGALAPAPLVSIDPRGATVATPAYRSPDDQVRP